MPKASKVLICHASFEDRSVGIVERTGSGVYDQAIVFATDEVERVEDYKNNMTAILAGLRQRNVKKIEDVVLTRSKKLCFLHELAVRLKGLSSSSQIDLDFSTFPRDRLLMTLNYLHQQHLGMEIRLLHTSPTSYATDEEVPQLLNKPVTTRWLANGVKNVEPVPGFNGRQKARSQCLLVMQLGHERERPQIVANYLEPDKIIAFGQSAIQYRDGVANVYLENNRAIFDNFSAKIVNDIKSDYNDWRAVKSRLLEIANQYGDRFNIFISPNGTKIQMLGAMAASVENKSLQIIYAEPQVYNYEASKGIGSTWQCGFNELFN